MLFFLMSVLIFSQLYVLKKQNLQLQFTMYFAIRFCLEKHIFKQFLSTTLHNFEAFWVTA